MRVSSTDLKLSRRKENKLINKGMTSEIKIGQNGKETKNIND